MSDGLYGAGRPTARERAPTRNGQLRAATAPVRFSIDEYRAAKKQRKERHVKWSIQNTSQGARVWQGRMPT